MKKGFGIINLSLIGLVLILDVLYVLFGGLWLKGLTSFGFVAIGGLNLFLIINCGALEKKFAITMFIGLLFAMLGDIVLNLFFEGGAVLFAIGHIFYIIAYSYFIKFRWYDLIAGAIIFVPSVLFIILADMFVFSDIMMELICVIYALIISIMVGKAITNLIKEKNLINVILVIGSVLFFISDLMLLLNVFGGLPRIVDILCLATYYPAQCLLALSLYLTALKYAK